MERIVSVRPARLWPSLGNRPDKLWMTSADMPPNSVIWLGRRAGAPLAVSAGMILTTVLTVLFVGISSVMLWLAIGAD